MTPVPDLGIGRVGSCLGPPHFRGKILIFNFKKRVTNFLSVIDQFVAELNKRLSSYEVICSRFGFLAKLDSCSPDDIHQAARKLVDIYTDDLEDSLASELVQFSYFVKTLK